jgi:protein SCO1/2
MGDSAGGQGTAKRSGWGTFLVGFVLAVLAGAAGGYLVGNLVGGGAGGNRGASPTETGERSPDETDLAADDAAGESPVGTGGEPAGDDPGDDNPYAGFRIGEFDLIDRDGEPVDESIFDGEVTVLTFFFTSCNGPCPAIARTMKRIQDRTRQPVTVPTGRDMLVKRLKLASISVDGGRDTPEVISAFADSYGASRTRWSFVTGDPEAVRELVRESIGFELREEEGVQVEDPSGAMMNNILHPTRLLLVGPDRRLIGIYAFNDADAVAELVEDALAAMRG